MTSIAEYVHTTDGLISASNMLDKFLFPPSQQYMKVEKLSGGEKRRLYLLRVLMSAPNILILDEPTNDLDIRTMTILEDYLDHFDGIVITVSHDRFFLDRVVNRIFSFEGNGHISQYEGGYTDYQVEYLRRNPDAESVFASAGSISGVGKATKGSGDTSDSDSDNSETNKSSGKQKRFVGERKLKMTYKEQKEWETIEADIEAAEEKVAELDEEILKYAKDFIKLNELTQEKERIENLLAEKMDRWEYLSDLNERIQSQ
jgi:ATP-binding cassette subfamily F protein uup